MLKGKTKSGFNYEIDENTLDDMELLEMFSNLEENPMIIVKALNKMLGEEQKEDLYDHVRTEDGRVPYEAFIEELTEIFNKEAEIKNS